MTYPWKLPKAHGRNWVVPLLTEPGIDINWKARFDYFKMVDGTLVESKYIDEDGNYIGKLKKSEYYHSGKVYQSIPDFLTAYIKRADQIEHSPVVEESLDEVSLGGSIDGDVSISLEPVESAPDSEPSGSEAAAPSSPPSSPPSSDKPLSAQNPQRPVDLDSYKIKDYEKPQRELEVFRFVIRAPLNELNLRKLHAISILTEGTIPLRLVSNTGSIIINEQQGIMVNPEEFAVLSKMFGIS
jgi:hypothetical protein